VGNLGFLGWLVCWLCWGRAGNGVVGLARLGEVIGVDQLEGGVLGLKGNDPVGTESFVACAGAGHTVTASRTDSFETADLDRCLG
jgi:hypothetical protein